jgi:hypothetical protein
MSTRAALVTRLALVGLLGLVLAACASSEDDTQVRSPTRPTRLLLIKSDGPEPDAPPPALGKGKMERMREAQLAPSAAMAARPIVMPRSRPMPPPRH